MNYATNEEFLRKFAREYISSGFEPYQKEMIIREFIHLRTCGYDSTWIDYRQKWLNERIKQAVAEYSPTLKYLIEREAICIEKAYVYEFGD